MIPYLIDKDFDLQRLVDADGKLICDSNGLDIYVQNPAPSVPTDHGVGVLYDTTYCKAVHGLNGEDEIELRYPVDGALFDKLELRAVIVARVDRVRGNQPYRIYRITKPLNGIVTVYARHLAYDLAGIVVEPFTASGITAALAGLKSHAMTNCPFTFSTTRTTTANFSVNVPSSIWSLMGGQRGSLLDVYGGEYTFDGYNITLENHVGSDRGVSVRYGVNMTDLEQDASCADCYTGVVAYWQSAEDDTVVYSPVVSAAGTYGYVKILSVDMSSKWEEQPTVEQLSAAASAYITSNQIGIPKVSWKVGFVPLDTTEEYKNIAALEQVSLGDSVAVKFEKLGVNASARVNAIEWDVLLDRYISVSLGSVKANIADTIARQTQEIAKVPTTQQVTDLAERISKTLTNAILGADGGSVRLLDTNNDGEPDTLYIADNPDPAQATKVWRFNYAGWAASANGYDGPFTMGATLANGLLADFVTAAHLTAGTIASQDGETFVLNLDNGTMQIGGNGIITSSDGSFVINLSTGVLYTTAEVTYDASDYSQSDVTRIAQIIAGSVTPTSSDYEKYDFYQDGEITGADLAMCQNMVNTGNDLTIAWSAKVQPNERGKTFSLEMNGNTVFRAGVNQIETHDGKFANKVDASVVEATTQIVVQESGNTNMILLNASTGRIDCNSLYINGQQVTP